MSPWRRSPKARSREGQGDLPLECTDLKERSGTALLMAELVAHAEPDPLLDVAVEALAESAFEGGARVFAGGVYRSERAQRHRIADGRARSPRRARSLA